VSRLFIAALQFFFLPGVKVRPKPEWWEELRSLGDVERLEVIRRGQPLCCLLLRRTGGASRKTAILAHPITRRGKYFFTRDKRLNVYLDLGYEVALFDFNGFGESPAIDFYYWKDVDAVLGRLLERGPSRHVILHGVSFGALHMSRAIAGLPTGSSVVIENVNKTLLAYWKRWWYTKLAVRFFRFIDTPSSRDMEVANNLANLDRPDLMFLFIACGADEFTPVDEMRELAAGLPSPNKHFVVFDGAPHLGAPQADYEKYVEAIRSVSRSDGAN
jgi:pimeloyl-ACP methyl ester carboxylesterase